jgi:hypothetical protein
MFVNLAAPVALVVASCADVTFPLRRIETRAPRIARFH